MTTRDEQTTRPEPGGSAPADKEFLDSLKRGPHAPIAVCQRAYNSHDLPWPEEDQVYRRHRATEANDTDAPGDQPAAPALPDLSATPGKPCARGLESRTQRADEAIVMIVGIVSETHKDVKCLKRAIQALLDRRGISIKETADAAPEP